MHFVYLGLNQAHYPDTAIISNERLNTIVIVRVVGQDVKCTRVVENIVCHLLSIRYVLHVLFTSTLFTD